MIWRWQQEQQQLVRREEHPQLLEEQQQLKEEQGDNPCFFLFYFKLYIFLRCPIFKIKIVSFEISNMIL